MLDDGPQIRLSTITPEGTTELPQHLQLRNTIREQKERLQIINKTETNRQDVNPDEVTKIIEKTMREIGLDRYGISTILQEFTYPDTNLHPDENRAIVIVTPMNYKNMITAPSIGSATEIFSSYKKGGEIVVALTQSLRNRGIQATGHHPLGDVNEYHQLLFPPHAVHAGLGEKGRTGLFIDYKYGPPVRLAIVTVDADLQITTAEKIGITEFCHRCRYCVEYCPPNALPEGKYLEHFIAGEKMEFRIKRNRCFKYFEKHQGCGRCIVHCILAESELDEIKRRMNRIENWYRKWIITGELKKMYEREVKADHT